MKRGWIHLVLGIMALLVAASVSLAASETAPATAQTKAAAKKGKKKPSAAQEDRTDINSASDEQLKALPGLSDEDVKKIIAGRPYARKNQLKQKNIITAVQYDGIKKQIVAKKAVK